jgi:putative protease
MNTKSWPAFIDRPFSKDKTSYPELLAPAGDFASFLGAINAGADAVYLAGEKFGARAYANNFTKEEILEALDYAHLHGAKIYLTVNTKTKLNEGKELFDYLNPLYMAGLDGVIVQDYGVFSYIHDAFPGLALHVSTQMCVTSAEGAEYLKNKGAARVVPARELTLPEIREINDLGIETECFIHGSMCYSYSGLCLFSSFLGDRSGNRGRCAGPCRQPYCIQGSKEEKYLLSLKDMCTIQFLPKLIDAGITSFKIEGRMKSPAYAAGVTRIYRKYIDAYLADPNAPYRVDEKDLDELKHLYLRTDLQTGYYEKTFSPSMVSITSPSYNKTDDALSASIIDSYCRNKVPVSVEARIVAECGKPFALRFNNPFTGEEIEVTGGEVSPAMKAPVSREDIVSRFRKSSLGMFSFDVKDAELSDNAFIPVGAMNNLRREAEEKLCENLKTAYGRAEGVEIPDFWKAEKNGFTDDVKKPFVLMIQNKFVFKSLLNELDDNDILAFPIEWLKDNSVLTEVKSQKNKVFRVILPYVFRSPNTALIKDLISLCETIDSIGGYYANQIDSLAFLKKSGVNKPIYGDYGLYTANPKAVSFLRGEISGITCDTELTIKEITEENVRGGEYIVYGRIPLMQTANCVKKTSGKCNHTEEFYDIKDRVGANFPNYSHCDLNLCYNTIYNSVPISLHKQFGEVAGLDLNAMQLRFSDESKEECIAVYGAYKALRAGVPTDYVPANYTKGHFKKSVL